MHQLKRWIQKVGNIYVWQLCRREYECQAFQGFNERPVELRFVFDQLAKLCPAKVLDVGTGLTALPSLLRTCGCIVTAIDNIHDYWPDGMVNRHFHVIHDDITQTRLTENQFDFVTCISVLEHIPNHDAAVRSMFSLLKPGGHLVLTFPYNECKYVDNVYKLPGSVGEGKFPFVTQVYSRQQIDKWLTENSAKLVAQEYWRFFTGEFWTLGQPLCPPVEVTSTDGHHITCLLFRKITA